MNKKPGMPGFCFCKWYGVSSIERFTINSGRVSLQAAIKLPGRLFTSMGWRINEGTNSLFKKSVAPLVNFYRWTVKWENCLAPAFLQPARKMVYFCYTVIGSLL